MKKILLMIIILIFILPLNVIGNVYDQSIADDMPFDIAAPSAILIDADTKTVMYAKNIDDKKPIASVTKVMTILLTLEAIEKGYVKLDEEIEISEYAASMGGSQVFLSAGEKVTVSTLLEAVIVASANDASVALAERVGGSYELFIANMNARAVELGAINTNFVNSNGLPADNHYSTARDIAIISCELVRHNIFFQWSTIWYDVLEGIENNTEIANTNKLIRSYSGCDGIKTGSTNEAKYCISATAKRNNMRLISVVLGAETSDIRFAEVQELFNYGFTQYQIETILRKGQILPDTENIFVSKGKESYVNGVVQQDCKQLVALGSHNNFVYEFKPNENIEAPIFEGQIIGTIVVYLSEEYVDEINVVAEKAIEKSGYFDYFRDMFYSWVGRAG